MDSQWGGEAKYRALLAVAQATNSHRDLSSVLQAVAGALEGLVSVDGLIVFTYEGERVRDRAIYLRGVPRPLEREPGGVPPTILGSSRRRGGHTRATGCATPSSGIGGRWCSTRQEHTQAGRGRVAARRCGVRGRGAADDG